MTPSEYVDEIVLPTVREFAEDRRSQRRAYLACLASLRITDHLRQAGEEDVEARIGFAAGRAFEALRAACDGRGPLGDGGAGAYGRIPAPGLMDGATAGYRSEACAASKRPDLLACLREVLSAYRTEYPNHFAAIDVSRGIATQSGMRA
jgi:hypothetical protein